MIYRFVVGAIQRSLERNTGVRLTGDNYQPPKALHVAIWPHTTYRAVNAQIRTRRKSNLPVAGLLLSRMVADLVNH